MHSAKKPRNTRGGKRGGYGEKEERERCLELLNGRLDRRCTAAQRRDRKNTGHALMSQVPSVSWYQHSVYAASFPLITSTW